MIKKELYTNEKYCKRKPLLLDKNNREITNACKVFNHNTLTYTIVTKEAINEVLTDFSDKFLDKREIKFSHLEIMM